jgi:cell division septum initiation protein DivIVA
LAGGGPDVEDLEAVKAELEISKAKIEELEQENSALKDKLLQYEGPVDEKPPSEAAQAVDSAPPDTKEGGKPAVAPDLAE